MSKDLKGCILAIVSGASFGLIPLFTIPVLDSGMGYVCLILYRFLFGSIAMMAFMLYKKTSLRITLEEFGHISILSLLYIICAITLFTSYKYISSGVSTSLIYTNPIWCSIIGILFCGEKFSWKVTLSLFLAVIGVMLLSGFFDADAVFSAWGIFLGLCSGIGYGIYLILLPRLGLKGLPSLTLTFYVFFIALLYLFLYAMIAEGGVEPIADTPSLVNLMLVGLLPTAFSNICVTTALRLVDTTVVSILGAFEPFTAMVVGICILDEPYSLASIVGGILVLLSVIILTVKR